MFTREPMLRYVLVTAKPRDTQENGCTRDQTVVQPIYRSALTATLRAS